MARAKANTAAKTVAVTDDIVVDTPVEVKEKPAKKTFKPEDLIMCRSLTQGELIMTGKKSKLMYRWGGYNDVTPVEYQDLYSLKSSRSQYINQPLFVIENDDVLADPLWKDIKDMYDKLYENEDMSAVLDLPLAQFRKVLTLAPEGYKRAICVEVTTRVEEGTFDSMNKIKALDEICGTDIKSIIA